MLKGASFILLCALLLATFYSCQKEDSQIKGTQMQLTFSHSFNGLPFGLNNTYINQFGESFSVSKFKYYISNITLLKGNSTVALPNTYFLINEASDSTKSFTLPVPQGHYDGISFLIGVDSIRNVSGAQTAALDPLNDMFWTWNSGYIMAKMEGASAASTATNNKIEYHIGGFKGPNNVLQNITLDFNNTIALRAVDVVAVEVGAELKHWFDGQHPLPIKNNPVVTTPGELAKQYAENYASMFYLKGAQLQ